MPRAVSRPGPRTPTDQGVAGAADAGRARPRTPKLSAVVACYRDAPAVPSMHERLTAVFRDLGVEYEIIFVNDASPDNARSVLAELARRDPRVTVVNHSRPFGSQSAFTSGMQIATGDAVILLDGDLQDPPELIPQFVERWRAGYDVVYGERVNRDAPGLMRMLYKLFYRLFRRAAYIQVPLDAGDFGLLDRRVVDAMNELPETHRFLRGLRAWVGFRQTGVPYTRPSRPFGESTNSLIKNLGWARRAILSFSYAPLDLIVWLALITVGGSLVAIIGDIAFRIADPSAAPKGVTTLLLVVTLFGSVQLLCISIVGSYQAHVYEEVKARPAYIVDDILNPPVSSNRRGGTRPATRSRSGGRASPRPRAKSAPRKPR
jgi:glycosyltransferase involved in cell wall biosynthesis